MTFSGSTRRLPRAIAYAVRRFSQGDVSMLATERLGVGGGLEIPGAERMLISSLGPDEIARIVRNRLGLRSIARSSAGWPSGAVGIPSLRLSSREMGGCSTIRKLRCRLRWTGSCVGVCPPFREPSAMRSSSRPVTRLRPRAFVRAGVAPSALDDAIELGLLVPSADRLRFSHPFVAAAVRARSTAERLREAHRRLARGVSDLDEQALHLARATEHPDEDVATKVERATERLRSRGAVRGSRRAGDAGDAVDAAGAR